MKVFVDAGSTKMEWVLLQDGTASIRYTTPGFNPNYADISVFDTIVKQELMDLPTEVGEVHYFGTGCGLEANRQMITTMLKNHFPQAMIEVDTDMMGAARGLFGDQKGIACILGTGANSCLYDGHHIVDRAVSLGYLVGDEGSGCYIGRKVVRAYFYGLMPPELMLQFEQCYHLEIKDFIQHTYHEDAASRYLAGFARFAGEHRQHPFIRDLVAQCFTDFIEVFVMRYKDHRSLSVSFVGSVAYHLQEVLTDCLESMGLKLGSIMKSPVEGLIQYYSDKSSGLTH